MSWGFIRISKGVGVHRMNDALGVEGFDLGLKRVTFLQELREALQVGGGQGGEVHRAGW
jgi:hypothetical protein